MLTQDERNELAKIITKTAMFYGKHDMTKDQISLFISVLDEEFRKSFFTYCKSFESYKQDTKNIFFPSPASLRKYIDPELDDNQVAVDSASRVIEAVSKFGWSNSGDAKKYIGDLGWKSVQVFGGWQYICENLGSEIQLSTFNAQIREISKAQIIKTKNGLGDEPIEVSYKEKNKEINSSSISKVIEISKIKTL